MRIAQVAPLYESVPPKLYGGTERVVSYLTEELVKLGHQVTLFASGESRTRARLVPCCSTALRLNRECVDPLAHHVLMFERVFQEIENFDIVHFHCDYLHFSLSRRCKASNVTTLHGRLDLPDLVPLYREFADMPVISISDAQRTPLSWLNWQGTVYHGLPPDLLNPENTSHFLAEFALRRVWTSPYRLPKRPASSFALRQKWIAPTGNISNA
jgi:glycosyltransferase involved in cell wall biosynthesis